MKRRVISLLLVVALLQGLLAGSADATAPVVIQTRTTSPVTLADAGGSETTVESLTLAAGSWTVSTNLTAINFGAGDYVRCNLQAGGTGIDGGATVYLTNRVAGLSNVGVFKSSTSTSVLLQCSHDRAAASPGEFYVDSGATITAVRGGPIRAPGLVPSGTPTVVLSRSTSHAALNDTSDTTVRSMTLPAGTWALTGSASAVDYGATDFAACQLVGASGASVTSSFAEIITGGSDAIVTGLDVAGTVTEPAAGATIALSCFSTFANDVTLDPGATITATKVTAPTVTNVGIGTIALPDAGQQAKSVVTKTMPAGSWRVRSTVLVGNHNSNNSWGGGRDFLRCGLKANGTAIDGGATDELTPNTNIEQITNAGSFVSSSSWTLTLSCSHDQAHTGDGHWSTFGGGAVVAINKGPIT